LAAILAAGSLALAGCNRPTNQESTYRIDMDNNFSWQGTGPAMRWLSPFRTQNMVSHRQQLFQFPSSGTDESEHHADSRDEQAKATLATEQYRSFVTADEQIMIQEIIVPWEVPPDSSAVRKYYIDHREEDRAILFQNIDGVIRSYLQTKPKDWIEKNQERIGPELLTYLRSFRAGGKPVFDSTGKAVAISGGHTLEEEWGIRFQPPSARRITPPEAIIAAYKEAADVVRRGKQDYDAAADIAATRRSQLQALRNRAQAIEANPVAAEYLTNQLIADLIGSLGSEHIGDVRIIFDSGRGSSSYSSIQPLMLKK
jgi:hypothetical protein